MWEQISSKYFNLRKRPHLWPLCSCVCKWKEPGNSVLSKDSSDVSLELTANASVHTTVLTTVHNTGANLRGDKVALLFQRHTHGRIMWCFKKSGAWLSINSDTFTLAKDSRQKIFCCYRTPCVEIPQCVSFTFSLWAAATGLEAFRMRLPSISSLKPHDVHHMWPHFSIERVHMYSGGVLPFGRRVGRSHERRR